MGIEENRYGVNVSEVVERRVTLGTENNKGRKEVEGMGRGKNSAKTKLKAKV